MPHSSFLDDFLLQSSQKGENTIKGELAQLPDTGLMNLDVHFSLPPFCPSVRMVFHLLSKY